MNHLSLFTGAGGEELGAILNGWRTIGAVEYEEYPCKVLEARQKDGCLGKFPIWFMDIREFNRRIAPMYTGLVDVLSAGFPCQPFSVAGKQAGADDPRNMWPATIEAVKIIKPKYCFFENVRGLLGASTECSADGWGVAETSTDNIRYFGTILSDLSNCGYDARWKVISTAEVGGPHKRDRLWIVAYPKSIYGLWGHQEKRNNIQKFRGFKSKGELKTEFSREYDGMGGDVDRLKAIGNGQVPLCAATAWRILSGVA
jgi:DNA (cytosine-5)-methyltransferase 1